MLYTVLCYNDEASVFAWTKEEDDAVMARLNVVHEKWEARGKLKPSIRLLPTSANRLPAAASYLRRPGDTRFRGFKLDVIRAAGGRIAEITTFGPSLFTAFGLPEVLPG